MPRNMSFMLTTDQVRNRTKTVTRRLGWKFLQPGDIVNAVKKGMGLKKGEKVEVLGQIKVVRCNRMILNSGLLFTPEEMEKEGFPGMDPDEFIDLFVKTHKGCTRHTIITRIEFEYL